MQVLLITGGSTGIGRAIMKLLQSKNFTVIGISRSLDRYDSHPLSLIQMDLHNTLFIQKSVETVVSQYGATAVLQSALPVMRTQNKLKPHYTDVPFLQRFSVYLKSYFPAKIYEVTLSKFYKL